MVGPTKEHQANCIESFVSCQRAIKVGGKDANRYWVNHQACSPSHKIHAVSGSL